MRARRPELATEEERSASQFKGSLFLSTAEEEAQFRRICSKQASEVRLSDGYQRREGVLTPEVPRHRGDARTCACVAASFPPSSGLLTLFLVNLL